MEGPITVNPFYRKFEDSDVMRHGDEATKTLALFAIAHEIGLLRREFVEGQREFKRLSTTLSNLTVVLQRYLK
jgi:hypothetical protein